MRILLLSLLLLVGCGEQKDSPTSQETVGSQADTSEDFSKPKTQATLSDKKSIKESEFKKLSKNYFERVQKVGVEVDLQCSYESLCSGESCEERKNACVFELNHKKVALEYGEHGFTEYHKVSLEKISGTCKEDEVERFIKLLNENYEMPVIADETFKESEFFLSKYYEESSYVDSKYFKGSHKQKEYVSMETVGKINSETTLIEMMISVDTNESDMLLSATLKEAGLDMNCHLKGHKDVDVAALLEKELYHVQD